MKKILFLLLAVPIYFFSSSFKKNNTVDQHLTGFLNQEDDSLVSKKAFMEVYRVLMSPRCLNCHPSGDIPLVDDDNHLHAQNVKRGTDGKGMYASKCFNCHDEINTPGPNKAPGSPDWRMPPANMKMIFQGRTARQLATLLLDTAENGNKTKADLIDHVSKDGLVLWGWNPGEGRSLPPLTHEEFTKQFILWIEKGAFLPDE